jgi:hypothetical protein
VFRININCEGIAVSKKALRLSNRDYEERGPK